MAASGENRWSYLAGPRWGWPYLRPSDVVTALMRQSVLDVCGCRETFSEWLGELYGASARVNAVPQPSPDTHGVLRDP
jgi:hypothetical protein